MSSVRIASRTKPVLLPLSPGRVRGIGMVRSQEELPHQTQRFLSTRCRWAQTRSGVLRVRVAWGKMLMLWKQLTRMKRLPNQVTNVLGAGVLASRRVWRIWVVNSRPLSEIGH